MALLSLIFFIIFVLPFKVFRDYVCVVLLLNLHKNICPSSFLFSSSGGSYASMSCYSTVDGEKVSSLTTSHAFNLLTPCSALVAILWFLVAIYIVRLSAKSDLSTPFPRISLIATRKNFYA